jgi:hypothetical protein
MKQRRQMTILGALLVVWVAVAVWAWSQFESRPEVVATVPADTSEIAFFIDEGGPVKLHIAWLDSEETVGAPTRDLFSTAPIAPAASTEDDPQAADAALVQATPQQPVIGAALRYMGYVETAGGTLALLSDGSQMYLARQGNRVGPGYLVAIVDEMFVEIEYRGARRRLPVSRREGDSNGQLR